MRIRTIKPEFWESETLGHLGPMARLTFAGLFNLADDLGRGRGSDLFIWSELHKYYDHESERRKTFHLVLKELEESGLVSFYSDDKGCRYFFLPGFTEHQKIDRRRPSIFPPPPKGSFCAEKHRRKGKEGKGRDQGKEGKGALSAPDDFMTFWNAYPRKEKKQMALKAWQKVAPDQELQVKIMQSLAKHSKSDQWTKDGGQFIPHPTTWLNQARWEDELPQPKDRSNGNPSEYFRTIERVG